MGSPTVTNPTASLSSKPLDHLEALRDPRQRVRHRTKRCRKDIQDNCHYGDNCTFYHTPKLSLPSPAVYSLPYQPCYSYVQVPVREAMAFSPQLYFPVAHRDMNNDTHQLESHVLRMNLDDSKTPVKHGEALPPVPPSTPSSPGTDISSSVSSPSVHSTGSEYSHTLEELQAPRQRATSGGSFYRTKPCKFFHEKGLCVKGNRCNFIHEPSQARRRSVSESDPRSPDADTPTSRRRRAAKNSQVKVEDVDKRGNYYPVMWRVIGGGVMMGGRREICEDFARGECTLGSECKFAHPVEEEEIDDLSGSSTPSCYELQEHYSPRSPLCVNPYLHYQSMVAFTHVINEPVAFEPAKVIEPTGSVQKPVLLDGSTLLPWEEPIAVDETAAASSVSVDGALLSARAIVRPLSTPPGVNRSFSQDIKNLRLFQAEMP